MPMVSVRQRLVNPGRRRRIRNPRKLSLKQKLHFGTPAQRAAAKRALSKSKTGKSKTGKANAKASKSTGTKKKVSRKRATSSASTGATTGRVKGYRKRLRYSGVTSKGVYKYVLNPKRRKKTRRVSRRKPLANVGQIITFGLAGNPGRKKSRRKRSNTTMARRKRRANPSRRRRVTRRRNAGFMKMFTRRRTRRANPGRRRTRRTNRGYRRNPGMLSGIGSQVLGIIGGAAATKFIFDKLVPVQYSQGITGYAVNFGVAYLQGYLVSRFAGKPGLGAAMQIGGYTQLALRILNDMLPGLSSYSALGLRGVLASSSFYTPQVPRPNSMTSFVTPNAVMSALPPPSLKGVRGGRN